MQMLKWSFSMPSETKKDGGGAGGKSIFASWQRYSHKVKKKGGLSDFPGREGGFVLGAENLALLGNV